MTLALVLYAAVGAIVMGGACWRDRYWPPSPWSFAGGALLWPVIVVGYVHEWSTHR